VSGAGAPPEEPVDGSGLSVAVVGTRWHPQVTDALVERAVATVQECGATLGRVLRVPGAFELPLAAQALAASHDAVIALGVIVRGGTPHFDYVCDAVTTGCTRVALDTGVPVGFGVLTCDTDQQALDRSGLPGSSEDKGREATLAAIETAALLRDVRGGRRAGF